MTEISFEIMFCKIVKFVNENFDHSKLFFNLLKVI